MRYCFFFLLLTLALQAPGQKKNMARSYELQQKLYKLGADLERGYYPSLEALGQYLDDTSFVQEYLGYHNYPNTARGVALRLLEENSNFRPDEYRFDSTAGKQSFLVFLQRNKVIFDDLTGTFVVTTPYQRKTEYQFRELSAFDLLQAGADTLESPYPDWYYDNQLDGLLLKKDPQALLWIASAWYHHRSRFNVYYFDDEVFMNFIKRLTRLDIGVPDEDGRITFLYKNDYAADAKLNFLVYWANHYRDYAWNKEKGYFENKAEKAEAKSEEELLFPQLFSEDNEEALSAYLRLAELDTGRVAVISREYYYSSHFDLNDTLPNFTFSFLPQLARLTQYCRDHQFSYAMPAWLHDSLKLLTGFPPFAEKYRVENNIIRQMTLDEVTALEYYGLTGDDYDRGTYSLGRILDKFYSEHLEEIAANERQLSLFLYKSKCFDELGIIGNCNKYLRKFIRCSPVVTAKLEKLQQSSLNEVVRSQCVAALAMQASYRPPGKIKPTIWSGYSFAYGIKDLAGKYQQLKQKFKEKDKRVIEVANLMRDLSYQQIPEAMALLMEDTAIDRYYRFNFLEDDFGIPFDSFDDESLLAFLQVYKTHSEKALYQYYVRKSGLDCLDSTGALLLPQAYDILRYGVVDGFVGGGGGRQDDGVYLVIKLLEFRFGTTLGFARKRCRSGYGNYCDCTDPAAAWMQYLEEKQLVPVNPPGPLSMSPNK